MKTAISSLLGCTLLAAFLSSTGWTQERGGAKPSLDVLAMQSVPDGHYLLNLMSSGAERLLNIHVKGNVATCVNSTDPELKGLQGRFELFGNGVFTIVLRNQKHTASQWWLFRPDGSASVKEVPDRGEKQRAVPVPNDSIEPPKNGSRAANPS